CLQYLSAPFTF
nr:immunoglobulin light chain junction region [Macaca mulatta]